MSIMPSLRHGILGFALVPCMVLSAEGPIHYGFSAHLNVPGDDLDRDLNGKIGAGGSFQVSIETSGRTIVRPRLDLDFFPVSEDRRRHSSYRDRVDLDSVGLGVDFLYAFSGTNDQGLYGLGGVGVQKWFQTFSSRDTDEFEGWERDDTVRNRTSAWLAVGLGYQFNPIVGLEARAVGSKYDGLVNGTPGGRTAVVGQLALTCRW